MGNLLIWKRTAAAALLFSFCLSPLSALGQTAAHEESVEATPTEIPEILPSPEEILIEVDLEQQPKIPTPDTSDPEVSVESTEESPMPETPDPGMDMRALNSGGTVTEAGSLFINNETTKSSAPEVDTQTGALRYSYQIDIPPGRAGMEPEISLNYSSNERGNTPIFGYGWSLSTPRITRSNKQGSDKMYLSSEFVSSLDGELVRVGTTTAFKPKVENGSFREYTFASSTWTVVEKDGTTMSFGTTSAARRTDTASSTRIYAWELEEMRDTNGNFVSYNYFQDAGQIYPSSISYTNHSTTTGPFLIEFARESRPDTLVFPMRRGSSQRLRTA